MYTGFGTSGPGLTTGLRAEALWLGFLPEFSGGSAMLARKGKEHEALL